MNSLLSNPIVLLAIGGFIGWWLKGGKVPGVPVNGQPSNGQPANIPSSVQSVPVYVDIHPVVRAKEEVKSA